MEASNRPRAARRPRKEILQYWGINMNAKGLLANRIFFLVLIPVLAEEKSDMEKLIGTWTYVSGEKNGDKVDAESLKKGSVVITKDTITLKSDEEDYVIKYQLDTKKKPWAIAMEITAGPQS